MDEIHLEGVNGQQSESKAHTGRFGINLDQWGGIYPSGRIIFDETKGPIRTQEKRRLIDISKESGVANIPFLRRASGNFDPNGLRFLKTDPLGACVALTLYHPGLQFGILPHNAITNDAKKGTSDIIDFIKTSGLNPSDFEARILGGGNKYTDNSAYLVRQIWSVIHPLGIPLKEIDLFDPSAQCIALALEDGTLYDYPNEHNSVVKNDHPLQLVNLPHISLPMPEVS